MAPFTRCWQCLVIIGFFPMALYAQTFGVNESRFMHPQFLNMSSNLLGPLNLSWHTDLPSSSFLSYNQPQKIKPFARLLLDDSNTRALLLNLDIKRPIFGFENEKMTARFKINHKRLSVEITPRQTSLPMLMRVSLGEESSFYIQLNF